VKIKGQITLVTQTTYTWMGGSY